MKLSDIWGAKEDQWTPSDQMRSDIRVAALTCHGRIVTLQADFPILTPEQIRESMNLGRGSYKAVCNLDLDWWTHRTLNREKLFKARAYCETTSEQTHAARAVAIKENLTWDEYPKGIDDEPI